MGELNQTLDRLWCELLLSQQRDSAHQANHRILAAATAQGNAVSASAVSHQLLQGLLRSSQSSAPLPLCSTTAAASTAAASELDRLLRSVGTGSGPATASLPLPDTRAMLPPSAFLASTYGRQSSLPPLGTGAHRGGGASGSAALSVFDICAAAANAAGDATALTARQLRLSPGAASSETTAKSRATTADSKPVRRRPATEHEKFVVLVKIVLKCLDKSGDPVLKQRVKMAVADCTKRNRMGDPEYTPLLTACERRLRRTVGELYWTRAQLLFQRYCHRQGSGQQQRGQRHHLTGITGVGV